MGTNITFGVVIGLALTQTAMADELKIECKPSSFDQSQMNCTIRDEGLDVTIAGIGDPDASVAFEAINPDKYVGKFQLELQCVLIRNQRTMRLLFVSPRTGKIFPVASACKGK